MQALSFDYDANGREDIPSLRIGINPATQGINIKKEGFIAPLRSGRPKFADEVNHAVHNRIICWIIRLRCRFRWLWGRKTWRSRNRCWRIRGRRISFHTPLKNQRRPHTHAPQHHDLAGLRPVEVADADGLVFEARHRNDSSGLNPPDAGSCRV